MNKTERKINKFLKKYQNTMTWIALPFIVIPLFLNLWISHNVFMVISMLIGAALCGFPIAFRAWLSLKMKVISIEMLVTIAVIGALCIGEYHECAIVTFLFQFGNYLELMTLRKTRKAIKDLVDLSPAIAYTIDGKEINADDIEEGDKLLVRAGEKVAVDGMIIRYEGYFNEASITGESKPVKKGTGDLIYAGTLLENGSIEMEATRVGDDTTYAKIIELVEEAQDAKSPVEKFIDRFAKYYTPFVIVFALITLCITRSIDTAITVLVLACPGALVIGAPVASVAGIGTGAKLGILYKGGDVIARFAKSDLFLFDKTGTLTEGKMQVESFYSYGDEKKYKVLAKSLEMKSNHPLAKPVVDYIAGDYKDVRIETIRGEGIICQDEQFLLGSQKLLERYPISLTEKQQQDYASVVSKGETVIFACDFTSCKMIFGIGDTLRENAVHALTSLKQLNVKELVMLTGDHEVSARCIGDVAGIDRVYANMLPEDKYHKLEEYQRNHNVTFVGDGINDTPSITKADTGIAMGNGTDVAIECSDIVLLNSDIELVARAYRLAKRIVLITSENIMIAVGTVMVLLIGLFMGYVHMSVGMMIHEGSILAVICNAMRLLVYKER